MPDKPRTWISKGALNLLRRIDAEEEEKEIVREKGAGWWVGCHRVSSRYAVELTRLCVIGLQSSFSEIGDFERWGINEDGQELLKDETYEPRIIPELLRRSKGVSDAG